MTWEEREVELITQVLCRVELPDQPVYAALVEVREAVKSGDKKRSLRATRALTETFLECVREGFRIGVGESPWAVLARQEELSTWSERLERRFLGPQRLRSEYLQEFVEEHGLEGVAEVAPLVQESTEQMNALKQSVARQIWGLLDTQRGVELYFDRRRP